MPEEFQYYGSVSHGTMLDVDLIPTLRDVLKELSPEAYQELQENWNPMLDYAEDFFESFKEISSDLTSELFDKLNALAPKGYYFGAHPGDGSDYGFWPTEEE